MASNPEYAEGEVIANKYVVEGLLGESPAARAFLATGTSGKLCVKFYRPEVSARLLAAPDFFLKAGVMTEIGHDNLCACIDVQEEMGMVFVARAFAEGQSFEDWIRSHLNAANYYSRGLELLWQTCQGLIALHERTRHLDIHPGNVLVGPIVAKLCDWDPRALSNMEMTTDALPVRSEYLGYRAPEQAARGSFLSYPSTDLFAVAGLLYRLIRGEHPSSQPAQNLGELRNFDKEIAVFLGKAMHPRPEERFQEAGTFSDALWDLQGAMQRLQERSPRPAPAASAKTVPLAEIRRNPEPVRPPEPAPERAEEVFRPARSDSGSTGANPGRESVLSDTAKPAPGSDTFFDFFPAAETAAPKDAGRSVEAKTSGNTLFGEPTFTARPDTDFNFSIPTREPVPPRPAGMGGLEVPGTLFGNPSEIYAPSPKPAYSRKEPPAPPKPLAISLSSLESDPLEMAGDATSHGFTTYGFKGAGDNRTGIYPPESNSASAKTKLLIALGAAGVLLILLGLGGLYLYLRTTAAQPQQTTVDPDEDAVDPPVLPAREEPPAIRSPAIAETVPYPETQPASEPEARLPDVAPATPPTQGYSEPPMPVEPGPPSSDPAQSSRPNAAAGYKGNNHVSPEREAELMAMARKDQWPPAAFERLKAADELNDLGRIAEANLGYTKALEAAGIGEKQRILALGGQAVTFQSMGMADQARESVRRILEINPRNGFALKLKEKLK